MTLKVQWLLVRGRASYVPKAIEVSGKRPFDFCVLWMRPRKSSELSQGHSFSHSRSSKWPEFVEQKRVWVRKAAELSFPLQLFALFWSLKP